MDRETFLESEGHLSTISSGQSDSFLLFAASGETRVDRDKQNPKQKYSSSCENKIPFFSAVGPMLQCVKYYCCTVKAY